jgi:hypothetical protein
MAKFPVEYSSNDSESVVDAINYVMSGPSGLGQNFAGFSSSAQTWLTGNIRTPSTRLPWTTPAHGASGASTVTISDPGTTWVLNGSEQPSSIQIGMYVRGTNIGVGARVAGTYAPTVTPFLVPLTVPNTGWVTGLLNFYEYAPTPLYVAPISIATIAWINSRTLKITFTAAQPTAPFELGNIATVTGATAYNRTYSGPGVVECTTTYVVVQSANDIIDVGLATGGTVKLSNTLQPPVVGTDPGFPSTIYWNSTDCQGSVIVNGASDRVFIAAQLNNIISYTATSVSDIEYTVAVNRYIGIQPTTVQNTEISYYFDTTLSQQIYSFPALAIGSGILNSGNIETIFSNVIDNPSSAYYLYKIDVLFRVTNNTGAAEVTLSQVGTRNISVQVVKE